MSNQSSKSLSLANPHPIYTNTAQKIGLALAVIGVLILFLAFFGVNFPNKGLFLGLSFLGMLVGTAIYAVGSYSAVPEGIKNTAVWHNSLSNRGLWGWIFGIIITGFYVLLYWFPQYLGLGENGASNTGLIALFDPLSYLLNGKPASQWFMYGTIYTVAILAMGYKFILKYKHNKYQVIRTISVMFFQLGIAYLLAELLGNLNSKDSLYYAKDLKNMWPLNYYFFEDWHLKGMLGGGNMGLFFLVWGLLMIFVVSPFLTYKYGKRWYCSWVCGCGGLAETAGDPYRQLSDKSLNAWKIERWLIHLVLLSVVVTTIAVLFTYFQNTPYRMLFVWGVVGFLLVLTLLMFSLRKKIEGISKIMPLLLIGGCVVVALVFLMNVFSGNSNVFFIESWKLKQWYGFYIGAAFSGVIGVGFYPIMGSRVWCRFGCPMAAILGIQQRIFSRFRITTNGGQCISCGNCSTYCEMGIDVRSYAQKGQDIVRASCVGCGICSAVCPRGVLRLENGTVDISTRTVQERAIHITDEKVSVIGM